MAHLNVLQLYVNSVKSSSAFYQTKHNEVCKINSQLQPSQVLVSEENTSIAEATTGLTGLNCCNIKIILSFDTCADLYRYECLHAFTHEYI